MCFADTVITSWSLTQEVAGSNLLTVMTDTLATEFNDFNENI